MILIKISLAISLLVLVMVYLLKNKLLKEYDYKGTKSTMFDIVQMIFQILIPVYNILMLFVVIFMADLIEKRAVEKGMLVKKPVVESEVK